MLTTISTDRYVGEAAFKADRETFDNYCNKYADHIQELARKDKQTVAKTIEKLWKSYRKDLDKEQKRADTEATQTVKEYETLPSCEPVDWDNSKVAQFTKWYTKATQTKVSTKGKLVRPEIQLHDKVFDSIQDSFDWLVHHVESIPEKQSNYRKVLLGKARFFRLDEQRVSNGLTTQGKVPVRYGRYLHIKNGVNHHGESTIENLSGDEPIGITIKGIYSGSGTRR